MRNGKILHISDNLPLSSEWSLTKAPVKPEGPDLVPTSDNVSSDGKVNTLSADKQTDGAESSEPYTITPDTYTNKKGKTTDVHLVTFNRELTAEEKAALDLFVREPLVEGRKTPRGWYDRKKGGYMMRSEEAARQLGEMLGNEEAVADAQPLSREDIRQAAEDAERQARELVAIEEQRRWEESPEGRAIISAREQAAEAADRVIEDVTDAEVHDRAPCRGRV